MGRDDLAVKEPSRSEWRRGWRPLTAGFFVMSMSWNFASVVTGLFLKPMQASFGWSRTALAFGPMAGLIVAILLPFVAILIDRFSARRMAIIGLLALGSAFALFAALPPNKLLFVGAVIYLGVAGSLVTSVTVARGVAPWFRSNFGSAVGIMMTGISLAAAIVVPAIAAVIEARGWRAGFYALAVTELAVGLPLLLLWFREPETVARDHPASRPGGPPDAYRVLMKSPAFWQLAAASGIAALPIGGFIGHLQPMLTDRGLSLLAAAGFASTFAVAVGIGRIATGVLFDRVPAPLVATAMLTLAAAGAWSIWAFVGPRSSDLLIAVSVALVALAQGAEGDYIKYFSMRLFGIRNFSRVVAVMATVISLGMALGGIGFAMIFDRAGSYQPAIVASIPLYLLGALLFGSIRMGNVGADLAGDRS